MRLTFLHFIPFILGFGLARESSLYDWSTAVTYLQNYEWAKSEYLDSYLPDVNFTNVSAADVAQVLSKNTLSSEQQLQLVTAWATYSSNSTSGELDPTALLENFCNGSGVSNYSLAACLETTTPGSTTTDQTTASTAAGNVCTFLNYSISYITVGWPIANTNTSYYNCCNVNDCEVCFKEIYVRGGMLVSENCTTTTTTKSTTFPSSKSSRSRTSTTTASSTDTDTTDSGTSQGSTSSGGGGATEAGNSSSAGTATSAAPGGGGVTEASSPSSGATSQTGTTFSGGTPGTASTVTQSTVTGTAGTGPTLAPGGATEATSSGSSGATISSGSSSGTGTTVTPGEGSSGSTAAGGNGGGSSASGSASGGVVTSTTPHATTTRVMADGTIIISETATAFSNCTMLIEQTRRYRNGTLTQWSQWFETGCTSGMPVIPGEIATTAAALPTSGGGASAAVTTTPSQATTTRILADGTRILREDATYFDNCTAQIVQLRLYPNGTEANYTQWFDTGCTTPSLPSGSSSSSAPNGTVTTARPSNTSTTARTAGTGSSAATGSNSTASSKSTTPGKSSASTVPPTATGRSSQSTSPSTGSALCPTGSFKNDTANSILVNANSCAPLSINLSNARSPSSGDSSLTSRQPIGTMIVHSCNARYVFPSGEPLRIYECVTGGRWSGTVDSASCQHVDL